MSYPAVYTIEFDATGVAPDIPIEGTWVTGRDPNEGNGFEINDVLQVSVTMDDSATESSSSYYSLRVLACPTGSDETECYDELEKPTPANDLYCVNITDKSSPGDDDYFTDLVSGVYQSVPTSDGGSVDLVSGMTMIFNPGINIKSNTDEFEILLVFGDPHKGKCKIRCKM